MANRSVPFSVRLSPDDASFIASLDIAGAITPSDKLRAIIERARLDQTEGGSYATLLRQQMDQLLPLRLILRHTEERLATHSVPLELLLDWLPDMQAYLRAQGVSGAPIHERSALIGFERGVLARLVRLMEAILRAAVTPSCNCYDSNALHKQVATLRELAELVVSRFDHKES